MDLAQYLLIPVPTELVYVLDPGPNVEDYMPMMPLLNLEEDLLDLSRTMTCPTGPLQGNDLLTGNLRNAPG